MYRYSDAFDVWTKNDAEQSGDGSAHTKVTVADPADVRVDIGADHDPKKEPTNPAAISHPHPPTVAPPGQSVEDKKSPLPPPPPSDGRRTSRRKVKKTITRGGGRRQAQTQGIESKQDKGKAPELDLSRILHRVSTGRDPSDYYRTVQRPPPERFVDDAGLPLEMLDSLYEIKVNVRKATHLKNTDGMWDASDPYVELAINSSIQRSSTVESNLNPIFMESFTWIFKHPPHQLRLSMYDEDPNDRRDFLGDSWIKLDPYFARSKEGAKEIIECLELDNTKCGEVYLSIHCRKVRMCAQTRDMLIAKAVQLSQEKKKLTGALEELLDEHKKTLEMLLQAKTQNGTAELETKIKSLRDKASVEAEKTDNLHKELVVLSSRLSAKTDQLEGAEMRISRMSLHLNDRQQQVGDIALEEDLPMCVCYYQKCSIM